MILINYTFNIFDFSFSTYHICSRHKFCGLMNTYQATSLLSQSHNCLDAAYCVVLCLVVFKLFAKFQTSTLQILTHTHHAHFSRATHWLIRLLNKNLRTTEFSNHDSNIFPICLSHMQISLCAPNAWKTLFKKFASNRAIN